MMDVSRVTALLRAAEEERDAVRQRNAIEVEQRKELEGQSVRRRRRVCAQQGCPAWGREGGG